jgi:hypothetical protein
LSALKTVTWRIGQLAASLIVLTHVEVLGAVAAAFMIVVIIAYCWTISSKDRSGRLAEIIRAFREVPGRSSPVALPARRSAPGLAKGARDGRRKRRKR